MMKSIIPLTYPDFEYELIVTYERTVTFTDIKDVFRLQLTGEWIRFLHRFSPASGSLQQKVPMLVPILAFGFVVTIKRIKHFL